MTDLVRAVTWEGWLLLALLLLLMVLVAGLALDLGNPERVVQERRSPTPLPKERPSWATDPRMPRPPAGVHRREPDHGRGVSAYRDNPPPPRIPSAWQ